MTREEAIEHFRLTGEAWIVNDPKLGFKRKFTMHNFILKPVVKQIWLDGEVTFFEDVEVEGEITTVPVSEQRIPKYWRTMIADTKDTGEGNEYEHFTDLAVNPIKIYELMYDTLMLRVSQGKLDI